MKTLSDQDLFARAEMILRRDEMLVFIEPGLDMERNIMLPKHLLEKPNCMLVIGYALPDPIQDLLVTDLGISGTLRFRNDRFLCYIPWCAVTGLKPAGRSTMALLEPNIVRKVAVEDTPNVVRLADWKRKNNR